MEITQDIITISNNSGISISQMQENRDTFLTLARSHINRQGIDDLLNWIDNSDFFTAPASATHHLGYPGGLCKHSLNVFNYLVKEVEYINNGKPLSTAAMESIAIVSLFHDLCKVNFYKIGTRNVKEDGKWKQVPYYTYDDKFPMGHGEKSMFIIMQSIKLSSKEALAVRWHMGAYDDSFKGGSKSLNQVYSKELLALLLHIADIKATYIEENK